MLQRAVIDERERFAVSRREQENDPAIGAWADAVLLFSPVPLSSRGQVMMSDFIRIA
jgi:hypothetical protein